MVRKLLIGGVLALLVLGAAGGAWYWQANEPVEKRGSADEEFDRTDTPGSERSKRKRIAVPWPTYGYDLQRTKVSPYDHRPPYRRLWSVDAQDTLEFPPTAGYGNVYIAQQKGLFFALDGKTGRPVFKTKDFKRCAASSPTIANGTVYQAYMDLVECGENDPDPTGFLIAMDARTGKEKWRFKGLPIESSPLLKDGILYFGSWDHKVHAIRAKNGKEVWSYDTGERVNTSPAYSGGRIFVANQAGSVYALNARTGKLDWEAASDSSALGGREFFYASPTVAYGRVFIGNSDGTMFAFGAKSGKTLWARPLGTYIYSAAAVWDQKVYVGTYDGKFFALDAATGDSKWEKELPSAVHSPATVMDGLVYVAACSSCGSEAARYVKMGDKDLTVAFDARSGRQVWSFPNGKYAGPIIADQDRVYLTGRSILYGFKPRRPAPAAQGRPGGRVRADEVQGAKPRRAGRAPRARARRRAGRAPKAGKGRRARRAPQRNRG
jgi:outer membrane protein assembly factor BamB